jgi:AcrR family transcriptional regulator
LFAHFGSKEELQLATVEEASRRFVRDVVVPAQEVPEGGPRLRAYCDAYLDHLERETYPGGCFWAAAAADVDDREGPVRDAVSHGVKAWLGELERQADRAGVEAPAQLAFELYSLVLGANATRRLLGDQAALARARTAIEQRLAAQG